MVLQIGFLFFCMFMYIQVGLESVQGVVFILQEFVFRRLSVGGISTVFEEVILKFYMVSVD